MLMTTAKLVTLRLFNVTLGRAPFFNRLLRKALVAMLVDSKKAKDKYVASSRFFTPDELDGE